MDALDEDKTAVGRVEQRMLEILDATTSFHKVIITCRTQFFPALESPGKKLLDQIVITDFIWKMLVKIEWVKIPAGEFRMGSKEVGNAPVHTVTLDSFYISKTLVTFDQYDLFCDETGRDKPDDRGWGRGNRPVINVSWNDANDYRDRDVPAYRNHYSGLRLARGQK